MIRKSAEGRSESGFTLLEVMIAMSILGIGLLSIAVAQLTAIRVSSRSKHLQDAMFLAREKMDTLEAIQPNGGPSFFSVAQTINDNNLKVDTDPEDQTRYDRQTVIQPNQPQALLSRVTVTVTWRNANVPGPQQVTLSSVMPAW